MNFYKLGMLEALEKFAIKMTASDLPPFSGMMDPKVQQSMNQDTLDLYRKMSPEARKKLNPMEQLQVGNLSADPRFTNTSGTDQRETRNQMAPAAMVPGYKPPAAPPLPAAPALPPKLPGR